MQVVSEYFSKKVVMEDSFSEFQEKKKINSGPKNVVKARVTKKKLKKVRGQKDIRKLIKDKESELVTYSKDFDKICKDTGVDVDSEHLQLAIALSKSLHNFHSPCESDNSQERPLTSLEKTKKIRITLQEYGFKASKTVTDRKTGKSKFRKQYKLLLVPEESRRQLILDRYSEVLATNLHKSPKNNILSTKNKSKLFCKATETSYEDMKNNHIFYVKDLCLETICSISLLRDWAEIPGRPLSPTVKINDYNFSNSHYTQDELDFILSGSIFTAQDTIKNKKYQKNSNMGVEHITICIEDEIECVESNKTSLTQKSLSVTQKVRSVSPDLFEDESILNNTPIKLSQESIKKSNQTILMDLTECVNFGSSCTTSHKTKQQSSQDTDITKRKSNDFMEITNCIPSTSKQCHIEEIDLTQGFIITCNERTKSNIETTNIDNVEIMDLTQSSNSEEDAIVEVNSTKGNDSLDDTIIVDDYIGLNQKSKGEANFFYKNDEHVITFSQKDIDNLCHNVDLQSDSCVNNEQYNEDHRIETENNDNIYTDHVFDHSYVYNYVEGDNIDESNTNVDRDIKTSENKLYESRKNSCITHTSPSHDNSYSSIMSIQNQEDKRTQEDDSLDISSLINANNEKLRNNHKRDIHDIKNPKSYRACSPKVDIKNKLQHATTKCDAKKEIDNKEISNMGELRLSNIPTENEHEKLETNTNKSDEMNNLSPAYDYNDYVFEHSYVFNYEDTNSRDSHENLRNANQIKSPDRERSKDDLILIENDVPNIDLSQDSDSDRLEDNSESDKLTFTTNIGKKDDVSIEYDEIMEADNINIPKSKDYELDFPNSSQNCVSTTTTNSSKNSDVFNVSDNEFNYSVNKSRLDDFESDGFDDIQKVSRKNTHLNRSMSENDLNIVNKRNLQTNTPNKALSQEIRRKAVETPKNDFIIKTNDVTPMADYASMSSPERNRELDKYGLKPFKRKRAIQLLTYLYNQTHPVVASCDFECLSPLKRPKLNSPNKSKSPRKLKEIVENKENTLYNETKLVPDIRDIHCEPEDWIFQTREKAKIHSCRVPLHIAFHNYVTCRGGLRESILRYEPINIDVIHKQLVANGYRYNPKDLLKFLDKKCITVKTADNSTGHRK